MLEVWNNDTDVNGGSRRGNCGEHLGVRIARMLLVCGQPVHSVVIGAPLTHRYTSLGSLTHHDAAHIGSDRSR